MAKPNALQAVLDSQAKAPVEEVPKTLSSPVGADQSTTSTQTKTAERKRKRVVRKASRVGTVLVGGHFPEPVARQLRIIAAEEGTTNQALLREALDLLFAKKGKERISSLV